MMGSGGETRRAVIEDGVRLYGAIDGFKEAKHHLAYVIGRRSGFPRFVMDRMYATGNDAQSAAEVLADRYLGAQGVLEAFMGSDETMFVFEESRQLESAFKGVYIWVSAYNDALC